MQRKSARHVVDRIGFRLREVFQNGDTRGKGIHLDLELRIQRLICRHLICNIL